MRSLSIFDKAWRESITASHPSKCFLSSETGIFLTSWSSSSDHYLTFSAPSLCMVSNLDSIFALSSADSHWSVTEDFMRIFAIIALFWWARSTSTSDGTCSAANVSSKFVWGHPVSFVSDFVNLAESFSECTIASGTSPSTAKGIHNSLLLAHCIFTCISIYWVSRNSMLWCFSFVVVRSCAFS